MPLQAMTWRSSSALPPSPIRTVTSPTWWHPPDEQPVPRRHRHPLGLAGHDDLEDVETAERRRHAQASLPRQSPARPSRYPTTVADLADLLATSVPIRTSRPRTAPQRWRTPDDVPDLMAVLPSPRDWIERSGLCHCNPETLEACLLPFRASSVQPPGSGSP